MTTKLITMAVVAMCCSIAASAQDAAPQSTSQDKAGQPQLKVTVVLSRYQGDKKIGSLPYVFGVAGPGLRAHVRMGVDVPVPTGSRTQKPDAPTAAFTYRPVGTNIDCNVTPVGGAYSLALTIEDSSIHLDPAPKPGPTTPAIAGDIPSFRTFRTSFSVVLRDGQTSSHTSATDPVTGEVLKIDVTLNVVK